VLASRFPDCSRAHAAQALRYHAGINIPRMVLLFSALLHAINTMKNTIDDADYIINWIVFIINNQ
jgi:succinate dehydrogenase hydrophobic anchor subunit